MLTVGHGTLAIDDFLSLLARAGVEVLVDVRSFPGSRRNPQFGQEALRSSVEGAGRRYEWVRELGGRRRPVPTSKHTVLRHPAFQAYADHMETAEFAAGIDRLLALSGRRPEGGPGSGPAAVMCSETVWWRCHRRLLSDHLVLVEGLPVDHLFHDGRLAAHPVTDGARLADGQVVYDVGVTPPLTGLD